MKVIIDEKDVNIRINKDKNLEDLLSKIQDYLTKYHSSKLIVEVKIDGEDISERAYDEFALDKINRVEIKTDNVKRMAVEGLIELKEILPRLSASVSNISTILQSEGREEALSVFSNACNEWRKIIQFFDNISKLLNVSYAELSINGKSIDKINEELIAMLIETKDAIEKDDLVMFSDLIEYELAPKINEELEIVNTLIKYLNSQQD